MYLPDRLECSKKKDILETLSQEEQEQMEQMEQAFLDYSHTVELYQELIRREIDHERITILKSLLVGYHEDNK